MSDLARAIREESGAPELHPGDAIAPKVTREVARLADEAQNCPWEQLAMQCPELAVIMDGSWNVQRGEAVVVTGVRRYVGFEEAGGRVDAIAE